MTNNSRDDAQASGLRVRPYAMTGGRTRSVRELPLEAIVIVTDQGRAALPRLSMEHKRIVELAKDPNAIVELSAHLRIPVGVARVLVGDLVAEGLLESHQITTVNDRPDLRLLERVLDGLQAL